MKSIIIGGKALIGKNEEEVIEKLTMALGNMTITGELGQTPIAEYWGVPCGLNIDWNRSVGQLSALRVTLFTSHQDKCSYFLLRNGIAEVFGAPEIEEYDEDISLLAPDERIYGSCSWFGDCSVKLRNVHDDEGGLFVMFY